MEPSKFPVFGHTRVARRAFLGFATALAASIGCAACGDPVIGGVGAGGAGGSTVDGMGGTTNHDPVWTTVPTISFVAGVPSTISVAAFVSDPDGDILTLIKNTVALPQGVTFDAASKSFVYDGVGAVAATDGHVLTADDGKGA